MIKTLYVSAFILTSFICHANNSELQRKVARMFIVGMRGTELTEDNVVIDDIKEKGVSGVILFEHNIYPANKGVNSIEKLKKLCHDLQSVTDRKILVSIDQEGGRVNRLKEKYGFKKMVSHQYLGDIDNKDTTILYAGNIAKEVKDAGFNTNFAPCVDVNINKQCPVIGKIERSFSDDPYKVSEHAKYFIEEHHRQGLYCAVKHFPGHGSSLTDSHKGFVDVTSTWQEEELIPYKAILQDGGCDMVMISHVFNSKIDDKYPSTLSGKCVDSLLRGVLGWNGVVVTDDMHMKAISDNYSMSEALMLTINAGCDMIIISSNISKDTDYIAKHAIDAIVKLVEEGKITESRIDESLARIDKMLGD